MAWVAVDSDSQEYIYSEEPIEGYKYWEPVSRGCVNIPKGSIQKLIGRELTWQDEPVELKEE